MQIQRVVVSSKLEVGLQTAELDTRLEPNEILVETEASFVSAGTELSIYTAAEAQVYQPGSWCSYPFVAGYSNVGRIIGLGSAVGRLELGVRVYTDAPHASHHRYNLADNLYRSLAAAVPDQIPSHQASMFHMLHVAKAALDVAAPPQGRWVVVFGLGVVGNLAAQLFQLSGARVIGVDPSAKRRAIAGECGIEAAESLEAALEQTRGELILTAVEAVGHSGVVLQALKTVAPHGEVILLGSPRTPVTGDFTEVFQEVHLNWKTLKGALEWHIPTYSDFPNAPSRSRNHQILTQWLLDRRIRVEPLISHRLPAPAVGQGYEGLLNRKEEYTGVVLEWK